MKTFPSLFVVSTYFNLCSNYEDSSPEQDFSVDTSLYSSMMGMQDLALFR